MFSPELSDDCDDRNTRQGENMSTNTIDSVNGGTPEPATAQPKGERRQRGGR
jgi:hypothetical protein